MAGYKPVRYLDLVSKAAADVVQAVENIGEGGLGVGVEERILDELKVSAELVLAAGRVIEAQWVGGSYEKPMEIHLRRLSPLVAKLVKESETDAE